MAEDGETQWDRVRWALATLDRGIARRRSQQTFAAVVKRATAAFLDQKARSAGAECGVYYTKPALMVREALRQDSTVLAALHYVWLAALDAETAAGTVIDSQWPLLSHVAYSTLIRKLYLHLRMLKIRRRSSGRVPPISPVDVTDSISEDWPRDSGSHGHMDEEAFRRCMFEAADLYVEGVAASDYAKWLYEAAESIFKLSLAERQDLKLLKYRNAEQTDEVYEGSSGGGDVLDRERQTFLTEPHAETIERRERRWQMDSFFLERLAGRLPSDQGTHAHMQTRHAHMRTCHAYAQTPCICRHAMRICAHAMHMHRRHAYAQTPCGVSTSCQE